MATRVLEETGLLPHLNPGVLSWQDFQRPKPVAPSMGMMLETTATRLFSERGGPHFGSPDKDPAVRLRVLEDAGPWPAPFPTATLIALGEQRVRRHPGSHRAELPGQAGHQDARRPRRRPRGSGRDDRGGAAGAGARRADP